MRDLAFIPAWYDMIVFHPWAVYQTWHFLSRGQFFHAAEPPPDAFITDLWKSRGRLSIFYAVASLDYDGTLTTWFVGQTIMSSPGRVLQLSAWRTP